MAIYTCGNVGEAIALASKFKAEGKYAFFRGHGDASWNVVSTQTRRILTEVDQTEQYNKIRRFMIFCASHPPLNYLCKGEYADHAFAIMQHYGMPTLYIDFTTDPEIAAFFASDTDLKDCKSSGIICLSSLAVKMVDALFKESKQLNPNLPKSFLVQIDVSNLWRLQAQKGVFLFSPVPDIEEYISFDKIVYPYTRQSTIPVEKIYPDRKSPLEVLLDSFFDNEQKLVSAKRMKQMFEEIARNNPNATYQEAEDNLLTMDKHMVQDAKPHHSWSELESRRWLATPVDNWQEVWAGKTYEILVDFAAESAEVGKRLQLQIGKALHSAMLDRKQLIDFRLAAGNNMLNKVLSEYLTKCLRRLWDGARFLPYTDDELSIILSAVVSIFVNAQQLEIKELYDIDSRTAGLYKGVLTEPRLQIEMGGLIRADSSRALVSKAGLAAACRDDLNAVLVPELRDRTAALPENIGPLLTAIPNPRYIFDADKLKDLFVREIIPTQLVLRVRNENNPIFCSPFQLSVLGLP